VVIMDMKMPGLDGLHVSRLVKDLEHTSIGPMPRTPRFSRCLRSPFPSRRWYVSSMTR
jgi:CheY-like chemotaxis protein